MVDQIWLIAMLVFRAESSIQKIESSFYVHVPIKDILENLTNDFLIRVPPPFFQCASPCLKPCL